MLTMNEINAMTNEAKAEYAMELSKQTRQTSRGTNYIPFVAVVETRYCETNEVTGYRIVENKQKVKGIEAGSFYTVVIAQFKGGEKCK